MSFLSSFFQALIVPSALLIHYYIYVIFAAIVLSWLDAFGILNTSNRVVFAIRDAIRSLTEPYFNLFRRFIPPTGMVDLSPLVAIFVLYFLNGFVPRVFYNLAVILSK